MVRPRQCITPRGPRRAFGDVSIKYIGVKLEQMPQCKPATTRPVMRTTIEWDTSLDANRAAEIRPMSAHANVAPFLQYAARYFAS